MTLLDELDGTPDDQPMALAAGFAAVDDETWADAVRSAMKGRGPESLVRTTLDGLEIAPLYTGPAPDGGLPGASPHVRGAAAVRRRWDVHVLVDHPDPVVAAERLLADVEGGADGAIVAPSVPVDALEAVLGPVADRLTTVVLRPRPDASAAARALLAFAPDGLRVGLGVDPVGALASAGWAPARPDELLARAATAPGADRPGTWTWTLDATPWSDAGGSDAEVLGLLVAQVVHTLRGAIAAGVAVDDAVDRTQVLLPLDADQFAGLCSLRALRRLLDRVTTLAGASPRHRAVRTDVVMAPRVLTRRDPWVNLLRGTVVAFVAGVGGADGALVLPYDRGAVDTSPLGRRLARTTQLVLREESHLARVDDPAGGSWYVEDRTEALAAAAWEVVQEVDRQGGLLDALRSGWVASRLADTRARREDLLATRRLPLTGVSEFPDLDEPALDGVATSSRPAVPSDAVVTLEPLPVVRFADAFEALRDRSDAVLAATGQRPKVFLANLGPLAEHTARAGFARNLFAAGGIAAVDGDGARTAAEAADAFTASGTTIACVCGTDERYAELAGEVVAALRERGATRVYLAGRTAALGDDVPDGQRPDEDVRVGSDVVAAVHRAYAALGPDADPDATTEEGRR
ncbi:methylmalonyl-CoA mutase [Nitriliruptoraceae bacterium ZYF776]|nr:methylmalonyl-CoA mutase [Profundirhabdus halotolerans]